MSDKLRRIFGLIAAVAVAIVLVACQPSDSNPESNSNSEIDALNQKIEELLQSEEMLKTLLTQKQLDNEALAQQLEKSTETVTKALDFRRETEKNFQEMTTKLVRAQSESAELKQQFPGTRRQIPDGSRRAEANCGNPPAAAE